MRILLLDNNIQRHLVWLVGMRSLPQHMHIDLLECIDTDIILKAKYSAYILHSNNPETDLILDTLTPYARVLVFSGGYTKDLLPDDDYPTRWDAKLEYLQQNFSDLITNILLSGAPDVA